MKVEDVIKQLQKLQPSAQLLVAVHVDTKSYSVAQVTPTSISQTYGGATMNIFLPDDMHVVQRKPKH